LPFSVSTNPAALTAVTRVLKEPAATAVSTISAIKFHLPSKIGVYNLILLMIWDYIYLQKQFLLLVSKMCVPTIQNCSLVKSRRIYAAREELKMSKGRLEKTIVDPYLQT
jgi:hypothetical protein